MRPNASTNGNSQVKIEKKLPIYSSKIDTQNKNNNKNLNLRNKTHNTTKGTPSLSPHGEELGVGRCHVEGANNLLPTKEETWIPKNYRPIACLPNTFNILTSVITDSLYSHLEKEAIMTPEQRGGKKDCYGCRDQLMINNAILENSKKRKKNLSTAWIDYKKAFDSIPHSWILKCLQMYKFHQYL